MLTETAPAAAGPSAPAQAAPGVPMVVDCDAVRRLLPHSWPFLLVDRATIVEPGTVATGVKCVSQGEPHFAGHFPARSIMPGVLIVESLAQLAGILLAASSTDGDGTLGRGFLASVNRFKFHAPVVPGDRLVLKVERAGGFAGLHEFKTSAHVEDRLVAGGNLVIAL